MHKYLLRAGLSVTHAVPRLPAPHSTVHYCCNEWTEDGTLQRLNEALWVQLSTAAGSHPQPNAGSIDSQIAKATEAGSTHGLGWGKKVNGRKQHILVDTMGLILRMVGHSADTQHRDGAKPVLIDTEGHFGKHPSPWRVVE